MTFAASLLVALSLPASAHNGGDGTVAATCPNSHGEGRVAPALLEPGDASSGGILGSCKHLVLGAGTVVGNVFTIAGETSGGENCEPRDAPPGITPPPPAQSGNTSASNCGGFLFNSVNLTGVFGVARPDPFLTPVFGEGNAAGCSAHFAGTVSLDVDPPLATGPPDPNGAADLVIGGTANVAPDFLFNHGSVGQFDKAALPAPGQFISEGTAHGTGETPTHPHAGPTTDAMYRPARFPISSVPGGVGVTTVGVVGIGTTVTTYPPTLMPAGFVQGHVRGFYTTIGTIVSVYLDVTSSSMGVDPTTGPPGLLPRAGAPFGGCPVPEFTAIQTIGVLGPAPLGPNPAPCSGVAVPCAYGADGDETYSDVVCSLNNPVTVGILVAPGEPACQDGTGADTPGFRIRNFLFSGVYIERDLAII